MSTVKVRKSDAEIRQDVIDELRWDSRVDAADIEVEVERGIVTLTGTALGLAKKLAAQEATHRVVGVLDVANAIEIRPGGHALRTDAEVAQAVRHALDWDALVPADRIHSTVMNGEVLLEGMVDAWADREEAARAIRGLAGVHGITNNITVTPRWVEAEIVRGAIEEALTRQAEREAERVLVTVRDGIVILTGWVRTLAEKRAIIGAAAHAPGIRGFEDHLIVDPHR